MPRKNLNSTACCPLPTACSNSRPTWAEVDLTALIRNYRILESLLEPASAIGNPQSATVPPRLIPVVKADAYGHGAAYLARALSGAGATAIAVALVEEGIELRAAGIRAEILVLEGAWPGQEAEILRHGLTATVYSSEGIRRLDRAARKAGAPARVHVKVDTGMSRLGIPWDGTESLLRDLCEARGLRVSGVFSHLACADDEDSGYTLEQIRRFRLALECVTRAGIEPGEVHFANSAGLLCRPDLRGWSARPGIALYGYPPASAQRSDDFKPVLTLKTRVGHIHTVRAGESVGYNRRFFAARDTRAATLPIGYADGYDRRLSGVGRVAIRGRWVPVLGAVSMDMIVADITDLPEVGEGDEVIVLGSTTSCRMDAAVWADLLHTIPYEVLCGISPRVPRVYTGAP